MARLIPRWYQQDCTDAIIDALTLAANVNPLAAVVTGGGKALLNAMLCERIIQREPEARIMSLAPSMELVRQNVEEAAGYLSPALASRIGVYCAGLGAKQRQAQITIGTPQSVTRQVKRFGRIDYAIVDEAHDFDPETKTARRIVDGLREENPRVRFIGLTATPFRMKGLKVVPLTQCGLFDNKVYDLTAGKNFNRLVREGYLSPIVAPSIRFPQVDTEGLKSRDGDFDEAELARRAMAVTRECVSVALENAADRNHFMWFAVNIEHAQMIHKALQEAGESSVVIHGNLEKSERVDGIGDYLKKKFRHIVSVAMLTTGFNAKFVDCLVSLRPTRSLVLWRQILGRIFRPYPGKENGLVLDAGGNFARHGAVNEEIGSGDSRSGLWRCSEEVVESPVQQRDELGRPVHSAKRERSGLRFPVNSPHPLPDLRVLLGLMEEDTPGCGFLNDPEWLTCRNCNRPRQGFLALRRPRPQSARMIGDGDGYEIHDAESVVLKDEACAETRTLPVGDMTVTPEGHSVLNFDFHTDFSTYSLRLDFDRQTTDNAFYAFSRKFYEKAMGSRVPTEAYRVVLMREAFPKPVDITLTKLDDGRIFLTEVRFLRDEQLHAFRYDPDYR